MRFESAMRCCKEHCATIADATKERNQQQTTNNQQQTTKMRCT